MGKKYTFRVETDMAHFGEWDIIARFLREDDAARYLRGLKRMAAEGSGKLFIEEHYRIVYKVPKRIVSW